MALVYPVGIIIELAVSTNPATLLGMGTWVAHGTGRVTVGIDSGDTDFDTVDETGGAKTHTHTVSGYAKIYTSSDNFIYSKRSTVSSWAAEFKSTVTHSASTGNHTTATEVVGTAAAGSSLQPYIVVYRWRRTA